ncbi:hypothetical protein M0804_014027 [Polistes exclamans]|nr:hypothetical protein M0804_014027 [Polistes exclamans]
MWPPFMMASSELRRSDRRAVTLYHLLYMAMKIMRIRVYDSLTVFFKNVSKDTKITRKKTAEHKQYISNCIETNHAPLRAILNVQFITEKYSCPNYVAENVNKTNYGICNLQRRIIELIKENPDFDIVEVTKKLGEKMLNGIVIIIHETDWRKEFESNFDNQKSIEICRNLCRENGIQDNNEMQGIANVMPDPYTFQNLSNDPIFHINSDLRFAIIKKILPIAKKRENKCKISNFLGCLAVCSKTLFIKIHIEISNRFTDNSYVACSSIGKAAAIIDGTTVHTALKISLVLIVDVISMIIVELTAQIDSRLEQITGNFNTNFGGLDISLIGDLRKLPPVIATPIYKQQKRRIVGHFFMFAFQNCICEGCVFHMITTNIDVSDNLASGAFGKLVHIEYNKNEEVNVLFLEFTDSLQFYRKIKKKVAGYVAAIQIKKQQCRLDVDLQLFFLTTMKH